MLLTSFFTAFLLVLADVPQAVATGDTSSAAVQSVAELDDSEASDEDDRSPEAENADVDLNASEVGTYNEGTGCTDFAWTDSFGKTCWQYARDRWCENGARGPFWKAGVFEARIDPVTRRHAAEACCVCGGGVKGCRDSAFSGGWWRRTSCWTYVGRGWCTSDGGYGPSWKASWGTFWTKRDRSRGLGADTACCGCGGGIRDPSQHPTCKAPAGPRFKKNFGMCDMHTPCESVCDCGRTCGCQDHDCQKQCPSNFVQATNRRRRRRGTLGKHFTQRRRYCTGNTISVRRRCSAAPIIDYGKEVRRPPDCDQDLIPGFGGRAYGNHGCRTDQALCLRWNTTSRSYWVYGLARINSGQPRCTGLNVNFAPPADWASLQWVSLPGRFFLGSFRSEFGEWINSGDRTMPTLPWRALAPIRMPTQTGSWWNLTGCCSWQDPTNTEHPYCEVGKICNRKNGVSMVTCQYEKCSIGANKNDPKCLDFRNADKDEMCHCRDMDQITVTPR